MHNYYEQQAHSVHENVAFAPLMYLLAPHPTVATCS
jgi:hypothetical protein